MPPSLNEGLFPRPSFPRSLLEPLEVDPAPMDAFLWGPPVPPVVVPPPPPRIVSEPAVSPVPKSGFRPEYLVETPGSPSADPAGGMP